MNASETQTSQPVENDPEQLSRLLEIELIQKRTMWQQKTARNRNLKTVAFFFLFLVVIGGLAGVYFVFMQANERRQQQAPQTQEHGDR
jgi:type II secretory pathway component PulM